MPEPFPPLNFIRWKCIAETLVADVVVCRDNLSRSSLANNKIDQFWARAFVRAFFAYVESSIYEMRLVVRAAADSGRVTLNVAERSLIDEESYELRENGKPEARPKFLKVERNLRFTLDLFQRVFGIVANVDFGGDGWLSFLTAVKIRHRITHPRDPNAIDLTLDEVATLVSAFGWYIQSTDKVLTKAVEAVRLSIPDSSIRSD